MDMVSTSPGKIPGGILSRYPKKRLIKGSVCKGDLESNAKRYHWPPKIVTKQRWSEDHMNTREAVIGSPNYINSDFGFLNFFCLSFWPRRPKFLNCRAGSWQADYLCSKLLDYSFQFLLGSYCALEISLHSKLMCCNKSHPQLIRKFSCLSMSPMLYLG